MPLDPKKASTRFGGLNIKGSPPTAEYNNRANIVHSDGARVNHLTLYDNLTPRNMDSYPGEPLFTLRSNRNAMTDGALPPMFSSLNGMSVPREIISSDQRLARMYQSMAKMLQSTPGNVKFEGTMQQYADRLRAIEYLESIVRFMGFAQSDCAFHPELNNNGIENYPVARVFGITSVYLNGPYAIAPGAYLMWRFPRLARNFATFAHDGHGGIRQPGVHVTKVVAELVPWDGTQTFITRDAATAYWNIDTDAGLKERNNFIIDENKSINPFLDALADDRRNVVYMTMALMMPLMRELHSGGGGWNAVEDFNIAKMLDYDPKKQNEFQTYSVSRNVAENLQHPELAGVDMFTAIMYLTSGISMRHAPIKFFNQVAVSKHQRSDQYNAFTRMLTEYDVNVHRSMSRIVGKAVQGGKAGDKTDVVIGTLSVG